MQVTLKPYTQKFIEEQVKAGRFASPDEAIEAGVARLMCDAGASLPHTLQDRRAPAGRDDPAREARSTAASVTSRTPNTRMESKPPTIYGHGAAAMQIVCYALLDPSEAYVAESTLLGEIPLRISGAAICDAGREGAYLFSCDDQWRVVWDTWAESVEHALSQAEHQFPRTSKQWIWVKSGP